MDTPSTVVLNATRPFGQEHALVARQVCSMFPNQKPSSHPKPRVSTLKSHQPILTREICEAPEVLLRLCLVNDDFHLGCLGVHLTPIGQIAFA